VRLAEATAHAGDVTGGGRGEDALLAWVRREGVQGYFCHLFVWFTL